MSQYPRLLSWLLILLQFLLIGWLAYGDSYTHLTILTVLFFISSFTLMIWALWAMSESDLTVFPKPTQSAKLITNGPYRYVRHPIYTAVTIGCAGFLNQHFTWTRLFVYTSLVIVLLIKLGWEEKMLIEKFPGYKEYMKHTKKLFPRFL